MSKIRITNWSKIKEEKLSKISDFELFKWQQHPKSILNPSPMIPYVPPSIILNILTFVFDEKGKRTTFDGAVSAPVHQMYS